MLLSAFGTKILIYSNVKRSQAFETATNLLASRRGETDILASRSKSRAKSGLEIACRNVQLGPTDLRTGQQDDDGRARTAGGECDDACGLASRTCRRPAAQPELVDGAARHRLPRVPGDVQTIRVTLSFPAF